jgi:hypothetical protein
MKNVGYSAKKSRPAIVSWAAIDESGRTFKNQPGVS